MVGHKCRPEFTGGLFKHMIYKNKCLRFDLRDGDGEREGFTKVILVVYSSYQQHWIGMEPLTHMLQVTMLLVLAATIPRSTLTSCQMWLGF